MSIADLIEKLGRVVFESPFAGSEGRGEAMPELAEIRLAILDQVKANSHRVGGRDVFPHNHIRVLIRGIPELQAGVLRDGFFAQFCENEIRSNLSGSGYRFPSDLHVEIVTVAALPAVGERWLSVEVESRTPPPAPPAPRRSGRLVVVKGSANEQEIALGKARTNIGRSVDVSRSDGLSRRNDLAFEEAGEVNRTVSREHAHILYSKAAGEYRIFNDRFYKIGASPGNCGLWILRDGLSRPVDRGERGVRLQHGDEIHLGKAVLRFVLR
jgi:hypothetical protein